MIAAGEVTELVAVDAVSLGGEKMEDELGRRGNEEDQPNRAGLVP
jgi:hypothetical protein